MRSLSIEDVVEAEGLRAKAKRAQSAVALIVGVEEEQRQRFENRVPPREMHSSRALEHQVKLWRRAPRED